MRRNLPLADRPEAAGFRRHAGRRTSPARLPIPHRRPVQRLGLGLSAKRGRVRPITSLPNISLKQDSFREKKPRKIIVLALMQLALALGYFTPVVVQTASIRLDNLRDGSLRELYYPHTPQIKNFDEAVRQLVS